MPCIHDLEENDIKFWFKRDFTKLLGQRWNTGKKLYTPRLFSLLALSELVKEFGSTGLTQLSCLEAVPGVSIAGVIWKVFLEEKVDVVINSIDTVKQCQITITKPDGLIFDHDNVNYVHQDPNSLLHSRKVVNFIYLESYGHCIEYLEAACHAICHRGIICMVSTDLSTLFNKCPATVRRVYHGQTMKNEYASETAVRLILANLARAASRCCRGFDVLLTHVDSDAVVIIARILRGASHADNALNMVKKISHCRECHFRCLREETFHLTQNCNTPNCFCVEKGMINDGVLPPIVFLGPVYTGPIFDAMFLRAMIKWLLKWYPVKSYFRTLRNMIMECCCCESDDDETVVFNGTAEIHDDGGESGDNNENSQAAGTEEPLAKRAKTVTFESLTTKYSSMEFPALFTVPQVHIKKGRNPPKVLDVVQKLRANGYRASRTTFDPRGVRTSAPLKELCQLIDDISSETCTS